MQHNKRTEHQECQTLIKLPTHTNSKPKKKGKVWLNCVLVIWKPRFQWTQIHGHIANPPPPCICFLLLNSFLPNFLKENACIICCHKRRAWGEWCHGSTSSSKVSFYFFKTFWSSFTFVPIFIIVATTLVFLELIAKDFNIVNDPSKTFIWNELQTNYKFLLQSIYIYIFIYLWMSFLKVTWQSFLVGQMFVLLFAQPNMFQHPNET